MQRDRYPQNLRWGISPETIQERNCQEVRRLIHHSLKISWYDPSHAGNPGVNPGFSLIASDLAQRILLGIGSLKRGC